MGIHHLGARTLGKWEIHLPPLDEQRCIVDTVDSYFTRLDDVTATLERIRRNVKRYRASVLKAAVEGRLVPTEAELARAEGRGYEPASALLKRILAERRRRWEEAELAKMSAAGRNPKNHKWKKRYKEPAAPDTATLPPLPSPIRSFESVSAPASIRGSIPRFGILESSAIKRNSLLTRRDRGPARKL